jgi:AcrR family transcriptional regulator
VGKGDVTRQGILDRATQVASESGLEGLTIGKLADELEMSKSGLFAHFGSKESLQVAVLENAAAHFVEVVVKPALRAPRGEPRLRALFSHWSLWPKKSRLPGGCVFVAAAVELDDRPGPARDCLVKQQRDFLDLIATTARGAVAAGQFRKDVDVEQFAHDFYAVMLGYHHAFRLLRDPRAEKRAARAFEALVDAARVPH